MTIHEVLLYSLFMVVLTAIVLVALICVGYVMWRVVAWARSRKPVKVVTNKRRTNSFGPGYSSGRIPGCTCKCHRNHYWSGGPK